jgi:hypothetical protein
MLENKWTKYVKRFINIDSMSPFGKEIFFRSSPSVLSKEYVVPYPQSSVIGEDIMGLITSNTDYVMFINDTKLFGGQSMPYKLNGMDLAYYQLGYLYHTTRDNLAQIKQGINYLINR